MIIGPESILCSVLGKLTCPGLLSWKGSRGSCCSVAVFYSYLRHLQVSLTLQPLLLPCGLMGTASSKLGDEKLLARAVLGASQ